MRLKFSLCKCTFYRFAFTFLSFTVVLQKLKILSQLQYALAVRQLKLYSDKIDTPNGKKDESHVSMVNTRSYQDQNTVLPSLTQPTGFMSLCIDTEIVAVFIKANKLSQVSVWFCHNISFNFSSCQKHRAEFALLPTIYEIH